MGTLSTKKTFWLKYRNEAWREVTEEAFIRAERDCRFFPKDGDGRATEGFYGSNLMDGPVEGEVRLEEELTAQDVTVSDPIS